MISTILASNVAWQLIDMYFAGSDSVFTYCRLKSNGVLSSVMVNGNNTI